MEHKGEWVAIRMKGWIAEGTAWTSFEAAMREAELMARNDVATAFVFRCVATVSAKISEEVVVSKVVVAPLIEGVYP